METTQQFADGEQVTSGKLNAIITGASFESGDVANSTLVVTGGALKVGTITSNEMGALSVATGSLIDASVTTDKLADGSVTTAKLANLAVTGDKIAIQTITYNNLLHIAGKTEMQNESLGYLVPTHQVKYALGAAKAYGSFSIADSSRTVGVKTSNVDSYTRIDATHTRVFLTEDMASEIYTVLVSGGSNGTEHVEACCYDKADGSFKIRHTTEGSGRSVNFVVFGYR